MAKAQIRHGPTSAQALGSQHIYGTSAARRPRTCSFIPKHPKAIGLTQTPAGQRIYDDALTSMDWVQPMADGREFKNGGALYVAMLKLSFFFVSAVLLVWGCALWSIPSLLTIRYGQKCVRRQVRRRGLGCRSCRDCYRNSP